MDFLLRLQTAKQKSSTADRILPLKSPEKEGVAHVPTASEVDKGKKNLDAVETIALIIDKLQHVTISFQQSRASLPSMLPPEILELFVQKPGNARALLVRNGTGNLRVSSPMFIRPRIKRKKTKEAETELLSGTPQKTFQAQGQPHDHLEKSKT